MNLIPVGFSGGYLCISMKTVTVIGGGAAGMMAAYTAAVNGAGVTLIEKNEKLGKKVYITGKGRCNVTNACDTNEFFDFVNSNPKFLFSSIYGFDAFAVMNLLEENGCRLKTERGNRVFPLSDHSSDIIRTFENMLKNAGVKICKNTEVKDLIIEDDKCTGVILDDGDKIFSDAVIVCTGGKSYTPTGSDGKFFNKISKHGINVTEMYPGLVPFECSDKICSELMGLSLKNVGLDIFIGEKKIYSGFGEMLFTHFGISGPLVLTASLKYSKKYFGQKAKAYIDLKPNLSEDKLDARLLRDFDENKNKNFKTVAEGLLPKRLASYMCEVTGVPETKKINEITVENRKRIISFLKGMELNIKGVRGFDEAIITIGGVSTKEINPSTMESKKIKNLYFAGEMIDADACTGGFNLQIAWSTGHLAGESASLT